MDGLLIRYAVCPVEFPVPKPEYCYMSIESAVADARHMAWKDKSTVMEIYRRNYNGTLDRVAVVSLVPKVTYV